MLDYITHERGAVVFASAGSVSEPYRGAEPASYVYSLAARWIPKVRAQLAALLRLPENWSSHGSRRVSPVAAFAALELLRQIADASTPMPTVVPTSEGGVQLEWHTRGVDLELRVLSPSTFVVSVEDARQIIPALEEKELRYDLRPLKNAVRELSARSA